jgi:hypothetical protein
MTASLIVSRITRVRASAICAIALVGGLILIGAGLATYWRGWAAHAPIGYGADLPALLSTELFAASATVVGCIVARRRPRSVVAWLLVALGLAAAAVALGLYAGAAVAGGSRGLSIDVGGWLAGGAMQSAMGSLTGLLMFLFPDGRLPARRWRAAVVLLAGGAALRFAELALTGDPVPYLPTLENPHRLPDPVGTVVAASRDANLGLFVMLGGMVLGALSLVARYRRAGADVRRQVRWFVFAGTLVAATLAPLAHLFVTVDPAAGRGQDLWVLFFASASLFPAAVAIGVTRYRLYEIDRVLSRTFVYGTLTAILAGLFTASVGLSQRLFVALTGETSDLAIVLTTLVAASAYTPVRRRLEGVAERLFRYEEPRFGAYRASLHEMLTLLDPEEAARRLAAEAARELGTGGVRVELDGVAGDAETVPTSPGGAAAAVVPIIGRRRPLGRLVLAARPDGAPYRPDEIHALEDVAALLGRCLDLRGPVGDGRPRRGRAGQAPAASVPQATTTMP